MARRRSSVLAAILEGDPEAVESLRGDGIRVASALTFAEAGRVLVRAGRSGRLSEARQRSLARALRTFERRCYVLSVSLLLTFLGTEKLAASQ